MREILFRGKRIDNCEWVQGCFLYDEEGNGAFIAEYFEDKAAYIREVIPETVGQYTGLTDKNGKKIFEGDIVKYSIYPPDKYEYGVVNFEHCTFGIEDAGCALCVCEMDGVDEYKLEVIGKLHDNPELLQQMRRNETF